MMRMMRRTLSLVLVGMWVAAGLAQPVAPAAEPAGRAGNAIKKTIPILHANDLHGVLAPFARPDVDGKVGGLVRIATLVDEVRLEGQPVLVFDGGDTLHGTGIAHYTQGLAIIEAMNAIGYDAMVVGNHEFNWGIEPLLAARKKANFPFLSANLVWREDNSYVFTPYIILERGGVSFGVLGLSPVPNRNRHRDALDPREDPRERIRHLSPVEVAQQLVPVLRQQVDVLIVLSQLGHATDRMLAQAVGGIDIILGGDTQWLLTEPVVVGKTLIVESGCRGQYVSRLDLTVHKRGVISTKHQLIHTDDTFAPDPKVQALIDAAYANFPQLKRVVGYSTTHIWDHFNPIDPRVMPFLPLPEPGTLGGRIFGDIFRGVISFRTDSRTANAVHETVLGNFITDAIRYEAGTDVAVQRAGCIRAGLAHGNITANDLFTILPMDFTVVVYHLSGDLLRQLLEVSVGPWPTLPNSDHLNVSGLTFAFDPTRDVGQRAINVYVAGVPLDPTKIYSVAVHHPPDGRVWGRALREVFEQGEFVRDTGVFLRDALANYLKTHSPISPRVEGRIRIIK